MIGGRRRRLADIVKMHFFSSFFGITDIVASLLEVGGCGISQEDCVGNTPLVWASENGHVVVVEILLGQGHVKPDQLNLYRQTPLFCATRNGPDGVGKFPYSGPTLNPTD